MAKEINSILPSVGEFQISSPESVGNNAFALMGQAYGTLGKLVTNQLEGAAIEQAAKKGYEDRLKQFEEARNTKTPEEMKDFQPRKLAPGITKATKAYNQAFENMDANINVLHGTAELNKIYKESLLPQNLSNNPTSKFDEMAAAVIKGTTQATTPGAQAEVQVRLLEKFAQMQSGIATAESKYNLSVLKSESNASYKSSIEDLKNANLSNQKELSKAYYSDAKENIESQQTLGFITPQEAESAKKNLESQDKIYSKVGEFLSVQDEDPTKASKWLEDFAKAKPKALGLTPIEYVETGKLLRTQRLQFNRLVNEAEKEAFLLGKQEIDDGLITSTLDLEEQYKDKVGNENFLRLNAYYKEQRKKLDSILNTSSVWTDVDGMSAKTSNEVNAAYNYRVDENLKRQADSGIEPSIASAETEEAAISAVPVPAFQDKINSYAKSTNAAALEEAVVSYAQVNEINANNVSGVDKESLAIMAEYTRQRTQGIEQIRAAENARKVVFDAPEEKADRENLWNEIVRDKYSNASDRQKLLKKMSGASVSDIRNPDFQAGEILRMVKSNFMLTKNLDTALDMTKDNLAKTYGYTTVNGKKEWGYLPIEELAKIPEDKGYLVHNQVPEEIEPQLVSIKDAFDKGKAATDFYYEVIPNVKPSKEQIEAKRAEIAGLEAQRLESTDGIFPGADFELMIGKAKREFKDLTSNSPRETRINRVYRTGEKVEFKVNLQSTPTSDLTFIETQNARPSYSVYLTDDKGRIDQLLKAYSGTGTSVIFQPDLQKLNQDYLDLEYRSTFNPPSAEDIAEKEKARIRKEKGKRKQLPAIFGDIFLD